MTYSRSSWLFLRLLGLVYLIAFWSLGVQVWGLVGHDGILPAAELIAAAGQWADSRGLGMVQRFMTLPTILWLGTSDRLLMSLCVGGGVLSALLLIDIAPAVVLPMLWLLYLSFSVACRDFLSYQWDALLLEAGFLAIFVAPLTWAGSFRRPANPSPIARWLLWWLLFRLVFASGVVKLASGDPTWRGLTALTVHYETQPIPTPLGWYAHQLPPLFQKISTALVLVIELAVPFLIFAPRRARTIGCAVLVGLQLLIAATGNYAFFNLLTIALCLLLLDDQSLGVVGVRQVSDPNEKSVPIGVRQVSDPRRRSGWVRHLAPTVAAFLTVPISIIILASQLGVELPGSIVVSPLESLVVPFRSVNGYGLFAVMTTSRQEIIVEGSEDEETWLPYEFRYKPGDVRRAPPWVAPHQPRLDWQMWFAALDRYEQVPWFDSFCQRLLEGSPSVLALLERNPFPQRPPRFVRAVRYRYHMADTVTHRRDGVWWVREELGPYSPVLSLRSRTADLRHQGEFLDVRGPNRSEMTTVRRRDRADLESFGDGDY